MSLFNPIELERSPVDHEAHMANASAYMREALLLYYRGVNPMTPDRPFKLPFKGKKWVTQKPEHEKAPRHRSKHDNMELSENEAKFWRLVQRGYTPEQAGEQVGYLNPRSALSRIKQKVQAQGELFVYRSPKGNWTKEELETLRKMHRAGHTAQEIGDKLGRTKAAVLGAAKRAGLAKPNRRHDGYGA